VSVLTELLFFTLRPYKPSRDTLRKSIMALSKIKIRSNKRNYKFIVENGKIISLVVGANLSRQNILSLFRKIKQKENVVTFLRVCSCKMITSGVIEFD